MSLSLSLKNCHAFEATKATTLKEVFVCSLLIDVLGGHHLPLNRTGPRLEYTAAAAAARILHNHYLLFLARSTNLLIGADYESTCQKPF